MVRKLNSKLLVCALLCCITQLACATVMSRQQQVESIENQLQLVVSPTFMPPVISKKVKRLSIIYVTPPEEYPLTTSMVDFTINYLKRQQPDLTVVDREAVNAVQKEFVYQLTGNVSSATMSQIGKHLGADALLMFNFKPIISDDFKSLQANGGPISTSLELRLIHVEDGTDLLRIKSVAEAICPRPPVGQFWLPITIKTYYDVLMVYAASFDLASLESAFDENPLGFVPVVETGLSSSLKKETRPGVTVAGLLEGSPAQKSGLQRFDRIVRVNGRPITTWMDKIQLPAILTVERDGTELIFKVQ